MFLLSAAAMSCGTLLQCLDQLIWQIANYELCHDLLPLRISDINDITAVVAVQSLISLRAKGF
ncbi:MAG TPA: hypothetical protein VHB68_13470 [Steroidobacteraceae bacterium]|nr:hypothetical protein [Steroidobacteraceae bacterium]